MVITLATYASFFAHLVVGSTTMALGMLPSSLVMRTLRFLFGSNTSISRSSASVQYNFLVVQSQQDPREVSCVCRIVISYMNVDLYIQE